MAEMAKRSSLILGGLAAVLVVTIVALATRLLLLRRTAPASLRAEMAAPSVKSTTVEATLTQISLDGTKVLDIDPRDKPAERGVDTKWKARGPNDMGIVPLIEGLKRARSATPAQTELAVRLASDVPFRILFEIVFSANQAGYETFRLSTVSPPLEALVTAPVRGKVESASVQIRRDGFAVKASSGGDAGAPPVVGDCSVPGSALSVAGNTNFTALAACLRALRKPFPTAPTGIVTASYEVTAWQVLSVANVLRCGSPDCPKTWVGPDLYTPIQLRVTQDGPPSARARQIAELRAPLRACYQSELARGSRATYDFAVEIDVRAQGSAVLTVTPRLPESLEGCVRQVFSGALAELSKEPIGSNLRVPLLFKPQDASAAR